MEPSRFDELTKALATSTSRRQALKTIAATTLGGILGLVGIGTAFAKHCRPLGKKCRQPEECCSNTCNGTCICRTALQACVNTVECCSGLVCTNPGTGAVCMLL